MRSGWAGWRRKNHSQPSRTPGKLKGDHCQTDPQKKFFASSPKAYKHPQYMQWHNTFRSMNGTKASA
jgi:hypothetical protein